MLTLLVAAAVAAPLGAPSQPASAAAAWTAEAVRLEPVGGATIAVAGVGEYRGTVEVVGDGGGVAVVNEVTVDDYVRGIAEVPPSWPMEAQKAQAVAARTYALWSAYSGSGASRARSVGADICATEACQVYLGMAGERRAGAGRWVEAVAATSGQVLLHGDRPIKAKYSSSNGGHSNPGGAPYLPAVDDPHDTAYSPWARWTATFPLDAVASVLAADGEPVAAFRDGDGPFILRRRLPDGAEVDHGFDAAAIRSLFNRSLPKPAGVPVPVPSTRFSARTDGGVVVLEGGGYGHLLGLSQWGAYGKAAQGWSHDQILAAYYGGVRPTALGPDVLPPHLRVAVAFDRSAVDVQSTGRFRVVAADGTVLAHLAAGEWRFGAAGGGVAVEPPPGQEAPLAVALSAPAPDHVVVEVSQPAAVHLIGADGAVLADLGVLDAGGHAVPLAEPVPAGGRVDVVARADAGGGRVVTAGLTIAPPAATPAATPAVPAPGGPVLAAVGGAPDAAASGRAGTAAAAALLIAAVVAGHARRRWARPAPRATATLA